MDLIETILHFPGAFCHGIENRLAMVAGWPLSVCWRCLGLYTGCLSGWIILAFGNAGWKIPLKRELIWLVPSLLPFMIDPWANRLGLWQSPPEIRVWTGLLAGPALVRCLAAMSRFSSNEIQSRIVIRTMLWVFSGVSLLLIVFVPERIQFHLASTLVLAGFATTIAAILFSAQSPFFQLVRSKRGPA